MARERNRRRECECFGEEGGLGLYCVDEGAFGMIAEGGNEVYEDTGVLQCGGVRKKHPLRHCFRSLYRQAEGVRTSCAK